MSERTRRIQITDSEISEAMQGATWRITNLIAAMGHAASGIVLLDVKRQCDAAISYLGKLWMTEDDRYYVQEACRGYHGELEVAYEQRIRQFTF